MSEFTMGGRLETDGIIPDEIVSGGEEVIDDAYTLHQGERLYPNGTSRPEGKEYLDGTRLPMTVEEELDFVNHFGFHPGIM